MGAVNFQPIQTGSGNPSPDNIRPILPVLNLPGIGAVYGGSLDTLTGVLTVDRGFVEFSGSESWINVGGSYPQAFRLSTGVNNAKQKMSTGSQDNVSNKYQWINSASTQVGIRWQDSNTPNGTLFVYDSNFSSNLSGFKASLQDTPLQVCYTLHTTVTHALTDAQYKLAISQLEEYTGQSLNSTTVLDLRKHMVMNALHPETVSGNGIVSFTGNVSKPMKIGVQLAPVQDLHGYDNPWPAGGGVNKLDIATVSTAKPAWYPGGWLGTTRNANAGITQERGYANGSAGGFTVALKPGETYTVSWTYNKSINESCKCFVSSYNGTEQTTILDNVTVRSSTTRFSISFTVPSDSVVVAIRPTVFGTTQSGQTYDLDYIQIELGSTATTYAPYSNICPIAGHDSMTVTRTGKNLFDLNEYTAAGATVYTEGEYPDSYTGNKHAFYRLHGSVSNPDTTGLIGRKPFGQLTISFYNYSTGNTRVYFHYTDADAWVNHSGNIASAGYRAYTSDASRVCDGVALDTTQGSSANFWLGQLQIEIGSTATEYESPLTQTYPITFPVSAGTVYGGELTVNEDGTGQLVVDRAYATPAFASRWTKSGTSNWWLNYTDKKRATGSAICSHFTATTYTSSDRIQLNNTGFTELSDLEAYQTAQTALGTPIQIVYKLATPLTYSLTAAQIKALVGQNNIWTDAGDGINVKYWKH